ncbi:MAG TPA: oxygenase MpaB family protein [Microbacterium sp.]|uniref:oxygenase MpaB family protein n=1 Tax=Microbacterium sp. TaxID=51671 RepID=UPI002B617D7A|nr:oxygenase MpaB family protein [Microbacterium sp.]HWI31287.1 oxygenase MpaB family protein [Microbacterium sp.]
MPAGASLREDGTPDYGIFAPDSIVWQVITTPGPAAGRAFTSGASESHHRVILSTVLDWDPVFKAVREGTMNAEKLLSRTQRTSGLSTQSYLADTATVQTVARHLHKYHSRFEGLQIGTGKPYRAMNPETVLYAHVTAAHGMLRLYETTTFRRGRLPHRLSDAERDRYWAEFKPWALLMGCNPDDIPTSASEVREYYRSLPEDTFLTLEEIRSDVAGNHAMLVKINEQVKANLELPRDLKHLFAKRVAALLGKSAYAATPAVMRHQAGIPASDDRKWAAMRVKMLPFWALMSIPFFGNRLVRMYWGGEGLGLYLNARAVRRAFLASKGA